MKGSEAKARIKINKLLEEAGWRLLDDETGPANVLLENHVRITENHLSGFGQDFEKTKSGFVDFLLLDGKGFPLIVLEAKSENMNPLAGKEQARKYAQSQDCRFVLLSNGNIHYFWDLKKGNPYLITKFPSPDSLGSYKKHQPNPVLLINEKVEDDYVALTQNPNYLLDPQWLNEHEREAFKKKNGLKFLRKYQKNAVKAIQDAVTKGSDRFLFEMATGTGKTLVAAAVIKLFLKTGNANRVLFLVDRLELESQAFKSFNKYLKNDYKTVIYKENRDDWRRAEIVVTTVQSLLFDNKFRRLFSPTDFDLVISDEAHRSIGGNSRAVFEYFVGYKLGLTATPKDYLRKIDPSKISHKDPRELERRILLDTYRTFGCETGQPTYRYSLLNGVKEGFLVNPVVVDARTEITTQLLSDEGYSIMLPVEDGEDEEAIYKQRDFERKFYSETTNKIFCKTFLENALPDPISGELGKTIVFTVSQNHAAKITQILNEMADKLYPGKYNSDFAVQVTSFIAGAQQFTVNFVNNNLNGSGNFIDYYKTSKTRVCVTVGMMTTGYDCQDILNLCLMRPVFSPTDFIQIKGRGTRKYNFLETFFNDDQKELVPEPEKTRFKLFDFFANCEYFEEKFNYDEILKLPRLTKGGEGGNGKTIYSEEFENVDPDPLKTLKEQKIGLEGMKIDRMFFDFENKVKEDRFIIDNVELGNWEDVITYVNDNLLNKPEECYTLDKLRRSAKVDRKISVREIIEKIMGLIPHFKSKNELLEEEFEKFLSDYKPDKTDNIPALKYFFKSYVTDSKVRSLIDHKKFADLNVNPTFSAEDYKAVGKKWRTIIPDYVRDYISLSKFVA
ncbi:MAG: DEAD/DEAH box helicase family protein [Bacteroidales bacterium]|nr:DEAD/DEAH box helicase family protein [Bacteroidales bacterium]